MKIRTHGEDSSHQSMGFRTTYHQGSCWNFWLLCVENGNQKIVASFQYQLDLQGWRWLTSLWNEQCIGEDKLMNLFPVISSLAYNRMLLFLKSGVLRVTT